jgi:hypothetical protein
MTTSSSRKYTGQQQVTTAAVQPITNTNIKCEVGLQLSWDENNAGELYIGFSGGVTTANGYLVGIGEKLLVPTRNPSEVYVINSSGTGTLYWMVL